MRILALCIVLLLTGCLPSDEVAPAPPLPTPATQQLTANPPALSLSASALPAGGSYPTVTVTQAGVNSAPSLVTAQSTCISHGNVTIVTSTANGNSATFSIQALQTGSCVLVFGGINGATLIVPVTVTP